MSIEFNNGTVNVSQTMLAKRGQLNQEQLTTLQTIVSESRENECYFYISTHNLASNKIECKPNNKKYNDFSHQR